MTRTATTYVDYQQRAAGFEVGDRVTPYFDGAGSDYAGEVTAVWPAIGMVDVEFPHGSKRYPAEELQILEKAGQREYEMPQSPSVPGGVGSVPVSGGPRTRMAREVVALYWAQRDRKYRPCKSERDGDRYTCPRCRTEEGERVRLIRVPYKRTEGVSERLHSCPSCSFVIKDDDILTPEPAAAPEIEVEVEVKMAARKPAKNPFHKSKVKVVFSEARGGLGYTAEIDERGASEYLEEYGRSSGVPVSSDVFFQASYELESFLRPKQLEELESGYDVTVRMDPWEALHMWGYDAHTMAEGYDPFDDGRRASMSDLHKKSDKKASIGTGKNGYIAFYKRKQVEVYADSKLEARDLAAEHFRARRPYDVEVVLAEQGGKQVTHMPLFASEDSELRRRVIRLAFENPELRGELLPMIKEATSKWKPKLSDKIVKEEISRYYAPRQQAYDPTLMGRSMAKDLATPIIDSLTFSAAGDFYFSDWNRKQADDLHSKIMDLPIEDPRLGNFASNMKRRVFSAHAGSSMPSRYWGKQRESEISEMLDGLAAVSKEFGVDMSDIRSWITSYLEQVREARTGFESQVVKTVHRVLKKVGLDDPSKYAGPPKFASEKEAGSLNPGDRVRVRPGAWEEPGNSGLKALRRAEGQVLTVKGDLVVGKFEGAFGGSQDQYLQLHRDLLERW